MRRLLLAASLAPIALLAQQTLPAQQTQLRPHSMYEPPAATAAASLAASAKGVAPELLTFSEKSNWEETGLYADAIATMRLYEQRSKFIHMVNYGTTPEGRPMYALIVSKDKAFTPEAAHKTDKAVILIQSGIHSGEIEGKDAALMLVRDMAVTNHPAQAAWLDQAIFVVIPLFEIDGHEDRSAFNRAQQNGPRITGTRPQEQQLNLNRDYIKADTPEMRAFLHLYNTWSPDFMFDNHVTDGADYQYDVTWDMTQHEDIGAPSRAWVNNRYVPELNKRMQADGHLVSPYGALRTDAKTGAHDFMVEVFSPRYSHMWSGARNRPCLLVETHSLKLPKTRAWSNYDIMLHSINIVTEDPQALRKAVRDSDAADAAMAGHRDQQLFLGGKTAATSNSIPYHSLKRVMEPSPITGTPVAHEPAARPHHHGHAAPRRTRRPYALGLSRRRLRRRPRPHRRSRIPQRTHRNQNGLRLPRPVHRVPGQTSRRPHLRQRPHRPPTLVDRTQQLPTHRHQPLPTSRSLDQELVVTILANYFQHPSQKCAAVIVLAFAVCVRLT